VERKGGARFSPHVFLNMLDRSGDDAAGAYLTLLGASADVGDSGEVGRAIACAESSHSFGQPVLRLLRERIPWLMSEKSTTY